MTNGMKYNAIISVLVALLMCGCFRFDNFKDADKHSDYEHQGEYTMGGAKLDKPVDDLNITWLGDSVIVEAYDGDFVEFYEECDWTTDENTTMYYWHKPDGTLNIQYAKSGVKFKDGFQKTLHVKVPRSVALDDVEINETGAVIILNDVRCDDLEVNTVGGSLVLEGGRCAGLEVNCVSTTIDACWNKLPNNVEINTVSSVSTFYVPEDAGLSCELNGVAAELNSELPISRKEKRYTVFGDGACEVEMNAVSGKLNIKIIENKK